VPPPHVIPGLVPMMMCGRRSRPDGCERPKQRVGGGPCDSAGNRAETDARFKSMTLGTRQPTIHAQHTACLPAPISSPCGIAGRPPQHAGDRERPALPPPTESGTLMLYRFYFAGSDGHFKDLEHAEFITDVAALSAASGRLWAQPSLQAWDQDRQFDIMQTRRRPGERRPPSRRKPLAH